MSANPPEKVNHRHEAISDLMLANPWMKVGEIASHLGFTNAWVSTVINSGTFQAYHRSRREQFNDDLAERAQTRTLEVGLKALDKVDEQLERDEVDPTTIFDKALQRAGMAPSKGSKSGDGGNTYNQYNYITATPDELASARQRLRPSEAGQSALESEGQGVPGQEISKEVEHREEEEEPASGNG